MAVVSNSSDQPESSAPEQILVTGTRHDLFRYLTSPLAEEYRALLGLFAGPLLADYSPAEAAALLSERGDHLTEDQVYARCEALERWGNLVRGVRDTHAATIREFHRGRNRFHASKLGGRIYRDTESIMSASEGAREVARELLGATVERLDSILSRLDVLAVVDAGESVSALDVEALAGDVTVVFSNQRLFNESVSDFYAYLNQVLTRYDLVGSEYQQFKELLLTYIGLITADVTRHTPAIMDRLGQIDGRMDTLLALLDTQARLIAHDGSAVEQQAGRTAEEWALLTAWYTGSAGRSGPDTLRAAADQALGQLLTNAKRMLAAAGTGLSRRDDLIKLAGWFDESDMDTAHRLFAAAFGAYSSRHLLLGPDIAFTVDGVSTSWWDAAPVDVPVSLRERGDRSARGRTSPVPDPGLAREAVLASARLEIEARRAASAELVAAGDLHGAHVSPAARDLVMDQLGNLMAIHQDLSSTLSFSDTDLGMVLTVVPDPNTVTVISASDGAVSIHGVSLHATPDQETNDARAGEAALA